MASSRTFILYDEFIGMRRVTEVRAAMADKEKRVSAQNSLGIPHDWTEMCKNSRKGKLRTQLL